MQIDAEILEKLKKLPDDEAIPLAIEICSIARAHSLNAPYDECRGRMVCPRQYSEPERQLAIVARKAAMNRNVLYHGTRHAQSILSTGVLFAWESDKVSFTRSAEEAAYWALLPRVEGGLRGSILIFDRELLRCRYKIEPHHDPIWDGKSRYCDEAEEAVYADIINVGKYVVGFVSEGCRQCPDLLKTRDAEWRRKMETKLSELLYFVPDWRCRYEEYLKS